MNKLVKSSTLYMPSFETLSSLIDFNRDSSCSVTQVVKFGFSTES